MIRQAMTDKTHICLLRGINVSGHRPLPMPALKALFTELGFRDVTTYIQSGNVIFRADGDSVPADLAGRIEKGILERFGYDVPAILRSHEEWKAILESNPFLADRTADILRLYVTLLDRQPDPERVARLDDAAYLPDKFSIAGRNIYLYCPHGYGRTRLSIQFFEQKLKVTATTRNWNTMLAIAGLAFRGGWE